MRLELTRRTDLALRALLALRNGERRRKGTELAVTIDTTTPYIGQVMGPLVREGWVASEPGPHGGYRLATDLAGISLLQLIEAVEGPTADGRCVLRGVQCPPSDPCALHDAWTRARQALLAELDATPLDVAKRSGATT